MRKTEKTSAPWLPWLNGGFILLCLGLPSTVLAVGVSVQDLAFALRNAPHIQQRQAEQQALLEQLSSSHHSASSSLVRALSGTYELNNRWDLDQDSYSTDLALALNAPLDYQRQLGIRRAQTALAIEGQRAAIAAELAEQRAELYRLYVLLWSDYQQRHVAQHFLKAWRNMVLIAGYGQKRGEWTSADVRAMRIRRLQIEHALDDYNVSIKNFQYAIRALLEPEAVPSDKRFNIVPTLPYQFAQCLPASPDNANQGLASELARLDRQIQQLTELNAYSRQSGREKTMQFRMGFSGDPSSVAGLEPYLELNLSMALLPVDSAQERLNEGVARQGVESLRRERTQVLLDLEHFRRAGNQVRQRQATMAKKRQDEIALQVMVLAENIQRLKFRDIKEYDQLFANLFALYQLQQQFIVRQRDILLDGAALAAQYNLDISSQALRGCGHRGNEVSLDKIYRGLAMPNFTELNLQEFDLGWGVAAADVVGSERIRYQRKVDRVYEVDGPRLAAREAEKTLKLTATLEDRGGVYLWYPEPIIESEQSRQDFFAKLAKLGLNRVSFSFTPRLYRQVREKDPAAMEKLNAFMSEAKAEGLALELLLGDSNWILPKFRPSLVTAVQALSVFPFDGVSLDLEPNMLEDQGYTERELLPDLLESLRAATAVTTLPVSLSAHPRIFGYDDYSCFACELQKAGIDELKLMIYITNAEKVDFRLKTVKANSPKDMAFSLAISMEPILGKESSYFHSPRSEIAHHFEELVTVAKNNQLKSIMLQAWTETNRYFYEN